MARARGRETFGDMVRTVVIFGIIVIAVVAFLPGRHHDSGAQQVDYTTELGVVRNRAPFHVLAPVGLNAGWTSTHVTIRVPQEGNTVSSFDLGFYVREPDAYAHLLQSNQPGVVQAELGAKASRAGTRQVAGQTYQAWTDAHGRPALVRDTADGSTVVLDGSAPAGKLQAVLDTLAAALH